MSKKIKIIIGIIAIILLIFIIVKILKIDSSENSTANNTLSEIKYDEESQEYYILDEETGEVLHTASSESELYIYTIDPDYNPQNPDAVSDEFYEELEEN